MRWNLLWTATNSQQELSGYRKYGDCVKYAHSDDTRTQVTTVTRVFPTYSLCSTSWDFDNLSWT